jgi:hypothetical protein
MSHEANVIVDEARMEMRDEPLVVRNPDVMTRSMLIYSLTVAERTVNNMKIALSVLKSDNKRLKLDVQRLQALAIIDDKRKSPASHD